MTGDVETVEWRSLFVPRPVENPTYAADVVREVERFDERDCLFARMDLLPATDRYREYYSEHEEFEAADAFLRSMPPLGSTGAPPDSAMLDAIFGSILSAGRQPDVAERSPDRETMSPGEASVRVRSVARHLGADLVGIGPLRREFVYSHVGRPFYGQKWGGEIDLPHTHAVSLGFAMDYSYLRDHAPGFPVILESAMAYSQAATVACQLAAYIRRLGYSARAHHLRDYQVLSVPVAVDAGLGEMGRIGLLLTREFGASVRLSTVTTDLPLEHDLPVDLGIQRFCDKCFLCALWCPSGAIPKGPKIEVRGTKRWKLAAGRCYHYWRTCGSDCSLCVVACPWSKPDAETGPLRPKRRRPVLDKATVGEVRRLREALPAWQQKLLGAPDEI